MASIVSPSKQNQLGFLDLPAELRNDFYEQILQCATTEASPFGRPEQQEWLRVYETLLLSNKQVKCELESFLGKYVDRLTFHFTDVLELCNFVNKYQKHPLLSKAQYDLRWYKDQEPESREDLLGDSAITVLESAVGFDADIMEVYFDKVFFCRNINEPTKLAASRPFKWLSSFKVGDAFICSAAGTPAMPCLKVSAKTTVPGTAVASYTWLDAATTNTPMPQIQGYLSVSGRIADFNTSATWLKNICDDHKAEDSTARLLKKRQERECDDNLE